MNKILLTGLAAAALAALTPMPHALAKDVFIVGTAAPGHSTIATAGDYTWATGRPLGDAYVVQYPRSLAPLVGTTPLDQSVAAGVANALPHVHSGDRIVCISQGCLVAEQTEKLAAADGVTGVSVESFGDPARSGGGILTKLPGLPTAPRNVPPTRQYAQVEVVNQYDMIADAPDVSILQNPLAWANAGVAAYYEHPTYSQALVDSATAAGMTVTTHHGNTTTILIKQANLPLTRPLRQLGVPKAVVDHLDHVLRPIVDAGYSHPKANHHAHVKVKS